MKIYEVLKGLLKYILHDALIHARSRKQCVIYVCMAERTQYAYMFETASVVLGFPDYNLQDEQLHPPLAHHLIDNATVSLFV